MRVSCPFVLLAVFIAAQTECAPISPSSIVNHLGAHVEHPLNSVAITQKMSGDILHLDTALHSSLRKRDLSAPMSTAAGLLNLHSGVSTIDSIGNLASLAHLDTHSAVGTLPTVGALPAVGAIPAAGTLPTVGIPSVGAPHSLGHLPSIDSSIGSPKSKRDFGNFGGMPSFSSLGSSLPIGSGSLGNMGGLSNPLSGGLPMMNSVSGLNSLPTSTFSNLPQHAGGSNPIGAVLPMISSLPGYSSLPGLTKRGLGNLPMIGSLPDFEGLPLVSSGLSGVGSPVDAAGLSSLSASGLTGVIGGLDPLSGGLPMMNSIPGLSSISGLTKRGLGNLPMISAMPVLSNLPLVDPLHGLNSVPSFPQIPAVGGMTGGLPMASSIPDFSSLSGFNSKRGLTNSLTQFSTIPLMEVPFPLLGSPADAVSGYISGVGV